jgi:hypothetical protein
MEQRRKQVQSTEGFCMFVIPTIITLSHCRSFYSQLLISESGDKEWRSNQALLKTWTPWAVKLTCQFDWLLPN